jgi:hypothetical protein
MILQITHDLSMIEIQVYGTICDLHQEKQIETAPLAGSNDEYRGHRWLSETWIVYSDKGAT